MLHQYAEVNGIQLHYVTEGSGTLMLFLHGFPEFWYAWKHQLAEFGRDHQAVAPDLRGYNLSSKPAEVEQYQIPLLVEDIRGLIEHLGHSRCILVGHDWGGVVAWHVALSYPAYLEKLIIINAPHPTIFSRELRDNPKQRSASRYMARLRSAEAEQRLAADDYAALKNTLLTAGLQNGYMTEADQAAYLEAWSQPGALTGALNYYRAMGSVDHPSDVVQTPTLVIWGEQDSFVLTGSLEGLDAVVPHLTLKRVADASHWIIHEQPELVNHTIRAFIED
ncbi:MAG TPA: alpha/beta hydrolase [Herpetosiphonaceae bacterium]